MNQRRLWLAATIIAIGILGWFAITAPHTTRDIIEPEFLTEKEEPVPSVTLRDTYKKGVHTITGSVRVGNACTAVSADVSTIETGSTTNILVAITVAEDHGVCLQRAHDARFTATVTAPADLPVTATVNGVTASTTSL